MARRRGCSDCRLIEPVAGQWAGGRCPQCAEVRASRSAVVAEAASPAPPKPQAEDATVTRMMRMLKEYGDWMPGIWKSIDAIRSGGVPGMPAWPSWCYLPVSVPTAMSQAAAKMAGQENPTVRTDLYVIAALAAWRVTQGVYRFDATVADAVWSTPLDGQLPHEILLSIPEWCVYIETPGRALSTGERLNGFFAHLDYEGGKTLLHLWLDLAGGHYGDNEGAIKCFPVTLAKGMTLAESIADMWRDHEEFLSKYGDSPERQRTREHLQHYGPSDIAPLVNLLLYLCSVNAEMRERKTGRLRPSRPAPVKTKDGMRTFPPDRPAAWDVGWRLGAAIRSAQEAEPRRPGDGTHASPRPHVRRAHWHSFWTGPKATLTIRGDRKIAVKWLPPIAVNVTEEAEPIPTIRAVK